LEIEEKINKIKWCKRQSHAHFLLSTNGTCHLWVLLSPAVFR
jgi:serine/threonine-protein phosphatase 2A regulatory subunit B